jgi:hypothetical protein
VQTQARPADGDLIGAELVFGSTSIGHVLGVQRDPVSGRIRRLVTTYGTPTRRVAVPMEWVVAISATRVSLGVGAHSLDDLADQTVEATVSPVLAVPSLN